MERNDSRVLKETQEKHLEEKQLMSMVKRRKLGRKLEEIAIEQLKRAKEKKEEREGEEEKESNEQIESKEAEEQEEGKQSNEREEQTLTQYIAYLNEVRRQEERRHMMTVGLAMERSAKKRREEARRPSLGALLLF